MRLSSRRRHDTGTAAQVVIVLIGITLAARCVAQQNQFGGQDRADAAQRMIVIAVQQATDALPPMAGQAASYDYDPEHDTYVRSRVLGPTALHSTRPMGAGKLSLRVAASYFDLSETFGPATYRITPIDPEAAGPRGYANVGMRAGAEVGLVNFAIEYGLTSWIDVSLVVPLAVVDAHAQQSFTTLPSQLGRPPGQAHWVGAPTPQDLAFGIREGFLVYRRESFGDLGFDFADGTHVGLGRVSLGARAVAYTNEHLRLAFAPEIHLPSPSENELAGSESPSVLARCLVEIPLRGPLRVFADAAYDYDFEESDLRRFATSGGIGLGFSHFSVDAGISASLFDTPLAWTPQVARGRPVPELGIPATQIVVQGGNRLGDDFIDFVTGAKLRISQTVAFSAALTVPVNDQGFRPAAAGTLALEVGF